MLNSVPDRTTITPQRLFGRMIITDAMIIIITIIIASRLKQWPNPALLSVKTVLGLQDVPGRIETIATLQIDSVATKTVGRRDQGCCWFTPHELR